MANATGPVTIPTPGDWDEPVGLLRSVVVGAIIGVVLAFIGTTAGMLAADVEVGSAIGLGLFVAFWGGLGFGSMVGGVVWVSNNEDHGDRRDQHSTPAGTDHVSAATANDRDADPAGSGHALAD